MKIEDENLLFSYRIQINEDDKVLINNIEELIKSGKIYTSATEVKLIGDLRTFIDKYPASFRNAYFFGHLYQPLLVRQNTDRIVTSPVGLNEGETKFVDDVREYLCANKSLADEVYLLRNLTRSKGVGFYESHSFYPDFILWIKKNGKQTILFLDPKGLAHLGLDHPKLNLHRYLKNEIQKQIEDPNIKLDAFIISVTPFSALSKMNPERKINLETLERKERKKEQILFQYRYQEIPNTTYMERLFEIAMKSESAH